MMPVKATQWNPDALPVKWESRGGSGGVHVSVTWDETGDHSAVILTTKDSIIKLVPACAQILSDVMFKAARVAMGLPEEIG
jgi:hypothetical protein